MEYATDEEILEAYKLIKDIKPTAYCGSRNNGKTYGELSLKILKSSCLTNDYMVDFVRTYYYIAFRAKAMEHKGYKQLIEGLHTKLRIEGASSAAKGKLSKAKRMATRRANKTKATVTLDKWDNEYIDNIYKTARWLSSFCKQYHVDHIIPLAKGGLHTPDNLQIMPAEENLKKSDKLDFYD